ncbi:Hypothetical predicted protein [Mytilus galloprovincialis]|uniref:Uncharacterized protein n=1 Tax=Mytilus galloprovincialis TaxID=29158 RepID=A0A8B6H001_MYTGA|nr:Hypothetical predicted protein [Mytilus galloprovincialis]
MTETRLNILKACTAVLDLVHTSDNRKIHGTDVFQQRSSGAPGPTESSVTASISAAIDLKFLTSYSSRPHQCFACGLVTQVKMKRHELKKQLQTYWETTYGSCEVQEALHQELPFECCPVNYPWFEVRVLRLYRELYSMWTVNDNALKFFQSPNRRE